jgi:hypothetical protein
MLIASFTSWHGWDWQGWNALVALGTLGLASVTVWLAWSTRRSVMQQVAESVAGVRPVLTVMETHMYGDMSNHLSMKDGEITLSVENCGVGPALGTAVWLQFSPGSTIATSPVREAIGGALAPGKSGRVIFETGPSAPFPRGTKGKIEYVDIADLKYETLFEISRHPTYGAVVISQETRPAKA